MIRLAAAITAAACLAGCGGSGSATKPKGYKASVRTCLQNVGYTVTAAGNATRVSSAGGAPIANVQFFSSASAASAAGRNLSVDGATGGRAVAVFIGAGGSSADRRVIVDCLTP